MNATELEKGPACQTKLDIVLGYRNTVLRTKQVVIGCGGGFHQRCTQPYSPVARWMADVDVALNDEGQQYGNLDEASAIARIPRKGMVIWCEDHKQTPGGLRKSEEARVFRRKLMRRTIALRGDTTFLPPHMLGAIVHPHVKDVPGPQMAGGLLMRVIYLTPRRSSWLLRSVITCAALSLFDFGLLRYWLTLLPQSPSFHIDLFVFHITINNTKHALKPYTSNLQVPIKFKLHFPQRQWTGR